MTLNINGEDKYSFIIENRYNGRLTFLERLYHYKRGKHNALCEKINELLKDIKELEHDLDMIWREIRDIEVAKAEKENKKQ